MTQPTILSKLCAVLLCTSSMVMFSNLLAQNQLAVELTIEKHQDTLSIDIVNFSVCGVLELNHDQSTYELYKKDLIACTELSFKLLNDSIVLSEIHAICHDCEKNEKTNSIENLKIQVTHFKGKEISLVVFGKNDHIGEFAYALSGKFLNKKHGKYAKFIPIGTNFLIDGIYNELYYFNEAGEVIYSISTENRVNNKLPFVAPYFKMGVK